MKSIARKIFCSPARCPIVHLLCLTLALLPVLLLTACSDMPAAELVELKSESELRQIAQEECPPCTFVHMERQQNKRICHFTDDACGFAFTVSSYAYYSSFDGIPGGYREATENDWEQRYYDYVWDTTNARAEAIAKQAGFTLVKREAPIVLIYADLHTDRSLEQISDAMIELGHLVKSADVHNQYDRFELWAKHYDSERGIWRAFAIYRFKDDVTETYNQ